MEGEEERVAGDGLSVTGEGGGKESITLHPLPLMISLPGFSMVAQRWLRVPRLRLVSLTLLGSCLVLLFLSFATAVNRQTIFGPPLGADFAGFYTAGLILNQEKAEDRNRLYDPDLHQELYHQLLPGLPPEAAIPFVHPPVVAFGFRFLARLPYEWAFALWLPLSAGLYLAGLTLAWKALPNKPPVDLGTVLLLALSFEPFVMECWLGGQLSTVGFFCLALGLFLEQRQRPVLSGMALGLCFYKTPLLLLILPMLLAARRWRTLLGMGLGGLSLAGLSLAGTGWENCRQYAHVLFGFARTTTGSPTSPEASLELRLWKYVDINAFFRMLLGGSSLFNWMLMALLGMVLLAFLVQAWVRLDQKGNVYRCLIWGATITSGLVFNLYTGVYDSILVILGVLLAAPFLPRQEEDPRKGTPVFTGLLVLLYLVPWFSQPVARSTGAQLYTLVLASLACSILALTYGPEISSWTKRK